MKFNFSSLNQIVTYHYTSIKKLENILSNILIKLNPHSKGGLSSNIVVNLKNDTPQCMTITTRSCKVVGDVLVIANVDMGDNYKALVVDDVIDDDDDKKINKDVAPTHGNPRSDYDCKKGKGFKSVNKTNSFDV